MKREREREGEGETDRQTDRQRNEGRSRGVVKRNIQYISPDSETRSGFNCFLEPAVLSACRNFSGDFFLSFLLQTIFIALFIKVRDWNVQNTPKIDKANME